MPGQSGSDTAVDTAVPVANGAAGEKGCCSSEHDKMDKKKEDTTNDKSETSGAGSVNGKVVDKSPSKKEMDRATEAMNQLLQGKRHLLVQDIPSAVNSLQEACKLYVEQFGETANECGEAYFHYGRALLEMSRIESGVLGNALDGVPGSLDSGSDLDDSQISNGEGLTEKERQEIAEKVDEALKENLCVLEGEAVTNGKNAVGEGNLGEGAEADPGPTQHSEDQSEKSEEESDEDGEEGGSGEGPAEEGGDEEEGESSDEANREETTEEDDKEEEVTSLQLAWETLELAKVIYERQADSSHEMRLKLSQALEYLGEVGLETGNFNQSIDDFNKCLSIQRELLDAHDRAIAETYYQLGNAHLLNDQFERAVEQFQNAINVIQDRITFLKKKIENRGKEGEETHEENPDAFYTEEGEIKQLEELIPDILDKIGDTRASQAEKRRRLAQDEPGVPGPSTSSSVSSSVSSSCSPSKVKSCESQGETEKKATDISHLVRKKRKQEDEGSPGSAQEKKVHRSEVPSPLATSHSPDASKGGGSDAVAESEGTNKSAETDGKTDATA